MPASLSSCSFTTEAFSATLRQCSRNSLEPSANAFWRSAASEGLKASRKVSTKRSRVYSEAVKAS